MFCYPLIVTCNAICFPNADPLKMTQTPLEELISHRKRRVPPQPLYDLFTPPPFNTHFRKPIFKAKGPSNISHHFEIPKLSEYKENHKSSFPQMNTDESSLDQCSGDGSNEMKVTPYNLALESATVTTPPKCEIEPSSADNGPLPMSDEEEDQTVFFTPELFEDEEDKGSPQEERNTASQARVVSGRESPVLLSEENLGSGQGQTLAFNGPKINATFTELKQTTRSDEEQSGKNGNDQSKVLPHGQNEQVKCEEGVQVEGPNGQKVSKLRRLSRSRQKASSTQSGKLTTWIQKIV